MDYDYSEMKVVIVLNSKIENGVALNVVGHLSASFGHYANDHMGRKQYVDGSGDIHTGISKYPIIITKVKPGKLKNTVTIAKSINDLFVCDYPSIMFDTGHDDELAKALESTNEDDITYYGLLIFGNRKTVDDLCGKFSLWK